MVEILKITDPLERSFYEKQTVIENWSIREFQRQKQASLFLRLALSTDKTGILKLSEEGRIIENPEDIIRWPYVLDFLKMPEPYHFKEDELEKCIINVSSELNSLIINYL